MNKIEYDNGHKAYYHPGAFIRALIEDEIYSMEDFAKALDFTPEKVDAIIRGDMDLDGSQAERISTMTGMPPKTWLKMQKRFRDTCLRVQSGSGSATALPVMRSAVPLAKGSQ